MSEPIFDDPVVAEIHAARAKMLAGCDGDIEQLMRQVAAHQQASGHSVITAPFRERTQQSHPPDPAIEPVSRGESSPPTR